MRWLFAPAVAVVRGRNRLKQVLVGVLFSLPLAVAVFAAPPGWDTASVPRVAAMSHRPTMRLPAIGLVTKLVR